jgi:hypothetical protein
MAEYFLRASLAADVVDDTRQVRPTFDTIWQATVGALTTAESLIQSALDTFVGVQSSGMTRPVGAYRGGSIGVLGQGYTVSLYDITDHLAGTPAGPAFYSTHSNWPIAPVSGGISLPEQISCVCSYRADYNGAPEFGPPVDTGKHGPSRPRASMRGRFYLFPLNTTALTADPTYGWCQFTSTFHTDISVALDLLLKNHTSGADEASMVVWSRKNAQAYACTEYAVNLRPDVRRHRAIRSGALGWTAI